MSGWDGGGKIWGNLRLLSMKLLVSGKRVYSWWVTFEPMRCGVVNEGVASFGGFLHWSRMPVDDVGRGERVGM